jgi:hypothetical protein
VSLGSGGGSLSRRKFLLSYACSRGYDEPRTREIKALLDPAPLADHNFKLRPLVQLVASIQAHDARPIVDDRLALGRTVLRCRSRVIVIQPCAATAGIHIGSLAPGELGHGARS